MRLNVGDHIITKKNHVCGSNEWKIERVGIEFKIKCIKCGREVLIFKSELDKKIKEILTKSNI